MMEKFTNRLTKLLKIEKPIIQAGMVWASGWKLASAVSNVGGLGIIGSGSMYPDVLKHHINQYRAASGKPFAVNVPIFNKYAQQHIETIIEEKIPVVFTSAGNPKIYTSLLKENNITVIHVVSSSAFALKAQTAGCDAVVAEGFEAGGHNGREETTTMVLIPAVKQTINIPLIAAGGIATGKQMLAAMVLGADGVQIGSRFVCSNEASSHMNFKEAVVHANEGDTLLSMKKTIPVRLLKNKFFNDVKQAEDNGASAEELNTLLGYGRSKLGMFEGNMNEGELEIGQVSSLIHSIKPASEIVNEIWSEFLGALQNPLHQQQ